MAPPARVELGRRLLRGDPDLAFRLGVLVTVYDLPTAFPYYALVALLATSGMSDARQLAVLLFYTFLYLLPVLAVLGLRAAAFSSSSRCSRTSSAMRSRRAARRWRSTASPYGCSEAWRRSRASSLRLGRSSGSPSPVRSSRSSSAGC
ncbi:MAG TPA: hypothetical protein VK387_07245 [Thermoleophilaceae bacterium]|nr:hypothetical protein [Thermoleophilaceae bacterium]